jgi:hypothetical protein
MHFESFVRLLASGPYSHLTVVAATLAAFKVPAGVQEQSGWDTKS